MNKQGRSEERSGGADFPSADLSRLGSGERDWRSAAQARLAGPSERERASQSPARSRQTDGLQPDVHRFNACDTAESNSAPARSEVLILPDGRILVHNLTPAFADLLHELNPKETQLAGRTHLFTPPASRLTSHELPD